MNFKNIRFLRFFVLLIVFIAYLPTFHAYFQQDEWIAFGNAIGKGEFSLVNLLDFAFSPNVGHYVPFHHIFFGIVFKIVGISYVKWLTISILWHLAITYTVGLFLFKVLRNTKAATFGMLLFGLSGSAHQATTWVVADINTHGSTFFGMLTILAFIHSLDFKTINFGYLKLSILFIVISLLFKETTIGLFLTIPAFMFVTNYNRFQVLRKAQSYVYFLAGYILLRAVMFLLPAAKGSASVITSTQTTGMILYNMVTFPAKAFFQSLIPSELWIVFARKVVAIPASILGIETNTSAFDLFVQSQFLEILFISLFILVVILTVYLHKKYNNYFSKISFFALVFISFNSFIFALSPERSGVITFLDSRNLYLILVGSVLFLFSFLQIRAFNKGVVLSSLSVLFIANLFMFGRHVNSSILQGSLRQQILRQIETIIPSSERNILVYVSSDSSYYGLSSEKKTLPFQSGFGQTLLVYIYQRNHLSPLFYNNYFLWPIDSEGYQKNTDGTFYGYFTNYETLSKVVSDGNPVESVYAMKWYGRTESLVNITEEVRSKLRGNMK